MAGKQVVTIGSMHICPMCIGTVPHIGGPVASSGAPGMTINGQPIALMGDMCTCAGAPDTIVTGHAGITVNGIPVACVGDMTAHGGTLTTGMPGMTIESATPVASSTMRAKDIPFPEISVKDRIGAAIMGNGTSLKEAEKNIEAIKEQAQICYGEKENQKKEEEEEKELPKLQGEIIFCHGYLSSPTHNEESHWNASMDKNPDTVSFGTKRGENADEYDHTNQDDIYTANELNKDLPRSERTEDYIEKAVDKAFENAAFMKYSPANKYWGYWNDKTNDYKGSDTYATYFNALGHDHYVNGSHGLGSNAAHRLDHGISLGYTWAQYNWKIRTKKEVDNKKGEEPYIESFSPPYKPVTIVGHSQGCAMAAGIACGLLFYAKEMGWGEIALNMVYLGTHQPIGLWGDEYRDFIKKKKEFYEVDADFWDGYVMSPGYEKEDAVMKFLNNISDLFSEEHNKLLNEKGIHEHLKSILRDEGTSFKARAVQFTFGNDRGDLVIRDGDIPDMDNACSPTNLPSPFSLEMCDSVDGIPISSIGKKQDQLLEGIEITRQNKHPEIKFDQGTNILLTPKFIINQRVEFNEENGEKELWENGEYVFLALDWAYAFIKFKKLKQQYLDKYQEPFTKNIKIYEFYSPNSKKNIEGGKQIAEQQIVRSAQRDMLWKYGRIQQADLYAHFSPVGLITDTTILSDWEEDGLGKTIWERVKNKGESKWYRVEYKGDVKEMEEKEKRIQEKNYINSNSNKCISTSISNTKHIKKIVNKHVKNPDPKTIRERFKEWHYKRDWQPESWDWIHLLRKKFK